MFGAHSQSENFEQKPVPRACVSLHTTK